MMNILERINNDGVVGIMRGIAPHQAVQAVQALYEGGIRIIEVTFNSPDATGVIRQLAETFADKVLVGAGTVMNPEQVELARTAGASFVLSPNMDVEVIRATKTAGLVSVPGAATASEVVQAQRAGADIVKIFPAGSFGPSYIKDLLGPLNGSNFMVVGGVNAGNLEAFFKAGARSAGIGGSLISHQAVEYGAWDEIRSQAAVYRRIADVRAR